MYKYGAVELCNGQVHLFGREIKLFGNDSEASYLLINSPSLPEWLSNN